MLLGREKISPSPLPTQSTIGSQRLLEEGELASPKDDSLIAYPDESGHP